jgi:uncharacterized membrane protein (UPF0127 family)
MLMLKKTQQPICSELKMARTPWKRLVGLIGTKKFEDQALMFPLANHLHTFFMSIPIDVVYVDRKMKIVKIDHSLKPWRMPLPVLKAHSFIELPAGLAKAKQLTVGDELYVGD